MDNFTEIKGVLFNSLDQFIQNAGAYLPNLIGAILIVAIGLFFAWSIKWLILHLGVGIDKVIRAIGFASLQARLKWPLADILGWFSYWLIVLIFLKAALTSLNLPSLVELLGKLIHSIPMLLIAAIVIFGGVVISNVIRDKIILSARSIGIQQAELLGSLTRFLVIILAVIVGLTQIGIDVRLFEHILTILFAAVVGSVGLAFGLGAGPTVSNIISARYVKKNYQIGQVLQINNMEGKILELLPTGIILETETGRTFIPAKMFEQEASILLDDRSLDD